jgi:hypothetical protein
VEGGRVLHVHYLRGLRKCKIRAPNSHIGLGVGNGNLWWHMKVQMGDGNCEIQ